MYIYFARHASWLGMERDSVGRRRDGPEDVESTKTKRGTEKDGLVFDFHETGVSGGIDLIQLPARPQAPTIPSHHQCAPQYPILYYWVRMRLLADIDDAAPLYPHGK